MNELQSEYSIRASFQSLFSLDPSRASLFKDIKTLCMSIEKEKTKKVQRHRTSIARQ